MFVLDKNAKIIGKKIDEHQLEFFLESLLFEKGIIKDKPVPPVDKPAEKKEEVAQAEKKDEGEPLEEVKHNKGDRTEFE